jgi:hypothetical protein
MNVKSKLIPNDNFSPDSMGIRNDRLFTAQINKDGRTKFTTRNLE